MFALLQFLPGKNQPGFSKKRRACEAVPVREDGLAFWRVTARLNRKGQPDWERVSQSVGCAGGRLILQRGWRLPEGSGLHAFVPSGEYAAVLLQNAVLETLRHQQAHCRLPVAVIDPFARYMPFVDALAECASVIQVVTARPGPYAAFGERMMECRGVSLMISSDAALLTGSALVAAPDGVPCALPAAMHCPVFSTGPVQAPDCLLLHGFRPAADPSLERLAPDALFERLLVCAAAYELGNCVRLGSLLPECCMLDGYEVAFADVVKSIRRHLYAGG